MICPHCNEKNKCDCITCNPNKLTEGVHLYDHEKDLYICYYCKGSFSEGDSIDMEFNLVTENACKLISPELSLEWASSSDSTQRAKMEEEFGGYYILNRVFYKYFGYNLDNLDTSTLKTLKRDYKIKKVIS